MSLRKLGTKPPPTLFSRQDAEVEQELRTLVDDAQADPAALGVALVGSAAAGPADDQSDLDVWYIVSEKTWVRERRGRVDLVPTTLLEMRNAPDWLKPAQAYARVLWDKSGDVAPILEAARIVSRAEAAKLYDSYLNDFYRSLKAWRRSLELAARVECGRSLRFVGELLFALDGIRAPYPKEWPGKLGPLEPLVLEVARTAGPVPQQRLCAAVAELAAQHGYADVYASWEGEIDRVLAFEF